MKLSKFYLSVLTAFFSVSNGLSVQAVNASVEDPKDPQVYRTFECMSDLGVVINEVFLLLAESKTDANKKIGIVQVFRAKTDRLVGTGSWVPSKSANNTIHIKLVSKQRMLLSPLPSERSDRLYSLQTDDGDRIKCYLEHDASGLYKRTRLN